MEMTITDIINTFQTSNKTSEITFYEKASSRQIIVFEETMGIKLPEELKSFYMFCNGFESGEDMFRIIPLEEIIENKQDYQPNQFFIAEYLIYCDMWTINVNPQNQNDYGIYNSDADRNWLYLTNSFTEFLNCFLTNGVFGADGLYDWHNKVRIK